MPESKKQNFVKGSAILTAGILIARILGAGYRIPLGNILDTAGLGALHVAHTVFVLILTLTTAGVPIAMSRKVSSANTAGKTGLVKRYFNVTLPAFIILGVVAMVAMFVFADSLAQIMRNSLAAPGIRILAPAVFFACIVSVYRGYAQGLEYMTPTAMSQVLEAVAKLISGVALAWVIVGRGFTMQYAAAGANAGVTVGLLVCVPLLILYKRKVDRTLPSVSATESLPARGAALQQILRISAPIMLGASLMALVTTVDLIVVQSRLQFAVGLTESQASSYVGLFAMAQTIANLPQSFVVAISASIIPAIAASITDGKGGTAKNIMQSAIKFVNIIIMPASVGVMVMSRPIMSALYGLYGDAWNTASTILTIFGVAAFFVCLQLITTAILQANGYERIPMFTLPIGGALQIGINYVLSGNPSIGVISLPIGLLAGHATISLLNIGFIISKVKNRPNFGGVFIKPLLCTIVMGVAAYSVYGLLNRFASPVLGTGRLSTIIYLTATIAVSALVYGVLIIVSRTITRDDLRLLPKGERLADILRVK